MPLLIPRTEPNPVRVVDVFIDGFPLDILGFESVYPKLVALIQRVESDAEKIALNCLLLLVVTDLRSNLRQDGLVKRQIDDPATRKRLQYHIASH